MSSDWNDADNWFGTVKPGPADDVILSGTRDHGPTIPAGTDAVINYIQLQDTANFDLTITGSLSTKGSLIQATGHGFIGSGTLNLDNTLAADPDDSWQTGYVKVMTVNVRDGAVLEVQSTFGQLGPDTDPFSNSKLSVGAPVGANNTPGTLKLNGDHFVGYKDLLVDTQGTLKYVTGGTLTVVPLAPPQKPDPFNLWNRNQVEISEGQAVTLTGGYYTQNGGTATFQPGSSLSIGRFDNLAWAPGAAFYVSAGKVVANESASISSNQLGISFVGSTVEFYSPGVFSRNGGPQQTATLNLTARDGMVKKDILISVTAVKFLDYNPAGRYTSATQAGGKLTADGNLKLDGTTELVLRVDVGNHRMDTIFDGTSPVTLTGNQLKLTLDLRNTAGQMRFMFSDFVWGSALTAPANPFGGGVTATGWNATITADANSLDLALMKAM